jgi:predicted permease
MISRLGDARMDSQVLAFSLALSVLTPLLFGLLPALRSTRTNAGAALGADARRTAGAPASRARQMLILVDLALAVVLLAGAGLMIKSVSRLLDVDPGFKADHVLTMQVSFAGSAYPKNETIVAKADDMLSALRTLPGVASAATAGQIPLGGNGDRWGVRIQGRAPINGADEPSVERYSVTPDYFTVMGIPLKRGRLFTEADRAATEPVMLVGEETARALWPSGDPIGSHVQIGGGQTIPWRTVVGIVGNVRHQELAAPPTMEMYLPQAQLTDSFLTVVIRTTGEPALVADGARRAIRGVASNVPIYQVARLEDLVAKSAGSRRFVMLLLELFAAAGLLLAAVGVYGVISYSVSERTREIGIRAALGATRSDIVRLVFSGGLPTIAAGLGAGAALALLLTRYLQGSLYEVSATDPATLTTAAALLLAVALLAHAVPVARAMRVDPSIALRQQ